MGGGVNTGMDIMATDIEDTTIMATVATVMADTDIDITAGDTAVIGAGTAWDTAWVIVRGQVDLTRIWPLTMSGA